MSRYHLRIVLLSLGVLVGYGSALARHVYGPLRGHGALCSHLDQHAHDEGRPKPVQ